MKNIYAILLGIIFTLHAADHEHLPMINGNIDSAEILKRLKAGSYEVNAPVDYYKKTTLHYACQFNCKELVAALIQHGADVNAKCSINQETPLHDAAYWGHYDIVNILLHSGANKENKTYYGKTAADLAQKGSWDNKFAAIVQLLNSYEHIEDIKEPESN